MLNRTYHDVPAAIGLFDHVVLHDTDADCLYMVMLIQTVLKGIINLVCEFVFENEVLF